MKKMMAMTAALLLAGAAGAANAGNVQWSIGINFPVAGAVVSSAPPMYYGPPPVVYAPPPVVYAPPRVVYAPVPVVYAPQRYMRPVPVVYAPAWVPPGHGYRWRHHQRHRWHDDD